MTGPFDDLIAKMRQAKPQPIPPQLADLDGMISAAHAHASRVLIGEPKAELMPAWLVLTETGQSVIVSTPFYGEESKDAVALALRHLMREVGAVRYTMASEAWLASGKTPDRRPPSERDDRMRS